MVTDRQAERLDATAREEIAAELQRHADVMAGLRAADSEAFVNEVDRHLDRVNAILLAHARRHPSNP